MSKQKKALKKTKNAQRTCAIDVANGAPAARVGLTCVTYPETASRPCFAIFAFAANALPPMVTTYLISSKMLGGASQIVSMIRVKCNGT